MAKLVQMNFPPTYVQNYVKKWAEEIKKDEKMVEAQKAMADDIVTLVEIAVGVMQPTPEKPNKNN